MADRSGLAPFQHILRESEPLGRHTWLGVGGTADLLAQPTDESELQGVLTWAAEQGVSVHVLGGGSSVLIPDEGVRGLVIMLDAPAFSHVEVDGTVVRCGAGARLGHVVAIAAREGLAGLEALAGVPGTIGGAVRTNASSHGCSIGQSVQRVRAVGRQGQLLDFQRQELNFGYRESNLDRFIVLSVELALEASNSEEITRRLQKLWIARRASQPSGEFSHARLFKDAQGESASKLIEMAGARNLSVGGIHLHQADPNFAVIEKHVDSADVLELIRSIQEAVRRQLEVDLQPELDIW